MIPLLDEVSINMLLSLFSDDSVVLSILTLHELSVVWPVAWVHVFI